MAAMEEETLPITNGLAATTGLASSAGSTALTLQELKDELSELSKSICGVLRTEVQQIRKQLAESHHPGNGHKPLAEEPPSPVSGHKAMKSFVAMKAVNRFGNNLKSSAQERRQDNTASQGESLPAAYRSEPNMLATQPLHSQQSQAHSPGAELDFEENGSGQRIAKGYVATEALKRFGLRGKAKTQDSKLPSPREFTAASHDTTSGGDLPHVASKISPRELRQAGISDPTQDDSSHLPRLAQVSSMGSTLTVSSLRDHSKEVALPGMLPGALPAATGTSSGLTASRSIVSLADRGSPRCKECSGALADEAETCPKCGISVTSEASGGFTPKVSPAKNQSESLLKVNVDHASSLSRQSVRFHRMPSLWVGHQKTDKSETKQLEFDEETWRGKLLKIVINPLFEGSMCFLVIVNALWMGIQLEYVTRNASPIMPTSFHVVDWLFAATFVIEIVLRVLASGVPRFFMGPDLKWNVFDTVVVTMQVVEKIIDSVALDNENPQSKPPNMSFMRVIRVLRLVRVVRIVRVIRYMRELHTMVCSIAGALRAFGWTTVLFGLTMYTLSIYYTQLVFDHVFYLTEKNLNSEQLQYYFGSLGRSVLTLYQSTAGGVDWDGVVQPLMDEISPIMGVIFSAYIAFAVLVLMNVVTGVFMDCAQATTKLDKDTELVTIVQELFPQKDYICWDDFEEQLQNPRFEEYFKAMDLALSEARGLFNLLDNSKDGRIDADEFVCGCLRFTGPAKAIDLAILLKEYSQYSRWSTKTILALSQQVADLVRKLDESPIFETSRAEKRLSLE